MKHIFVFIGEAMTGKSILGRVCSLNHKTYVYDDVNLYDTVDIKNIIVDIGRTDYCNYVIIASPEEKLNNLTDRLKLLTEAKEARITVCHFEKLEGDEN